MRTRMTAGALLAHRAAVSPHDLFITPAETPDATLSYGEFNARVNAVAHGLAELDVGAGKFVASIATNSVEYLTVSYALKKLGAVEVVIHPEARGASLTRALDLTPASLLIADSEGITAVAKIAANLGKLHSLVTIDQRERIPDAYKGWTSARISDLVSAGPRANPPDHVSPTHLMAIVFTSGTTGPAKGCQLSHRYAVNCAEQQVRLVGLSASDRLYSFLPLAHVAGAYYDVLGAILAGAHLIMRRRYSTTHFWSDVRDHNVTVGGIYGFMAKMLYDRPQSASDRDHQ